MQQQSQVTIKKLETKLEKVETLVTTGFNDLKKLMAENERNNFTIKGSGYEVSTDEFKLFITSIFVLNVA